MDFEIDHVKNALTKLAYPKTVLNIALIKARKVYFSSNKKSPIEKKKTLMKLPYIKSLEKFQRPLNNVNTSLIFTYKNKLANNFCSNKPKKALTNYGVYEIPCKDCDQIYVGESGRDLDKRIKEHKNDIKNANENNAMFVHLRKFDHPIDFENAKIVYPSSSVRRRHIIESALIEKYKSTNECMNLNKGFSPYNALISRNILASVKMLS